MAPTRLRFKTAIKQGVAVAALVTSVHVHGDTHVDADILLKSALVYSGENTAPLVLDIAICGKLICYLGPPTEFKSVKTAVNAQGLVATPGFIDPHTHSLQELKSPETNQNINYLTQGVTTVINGNDGEGTPEVSEVRKLLNHQGIGTNVGLLVGHGAVRKMVMGLSNSAPSVSQIGEMKALVSKAMEEGALGLSTGLYYVPGSYAETPEVIALAKVAARHGGIYDSHIRDESSFNVGLLDAIREVIEISRQAGIKAHIAHIKALGVDVWGQSTQAIDLINQARSHGLQITADQYPWRASGTFLHSAVIPAWLMADSKERFHQRLADPRLSAQIRSEIGENIRRRGGPASLLVTASANQSWLGQTLQEIAADMNLTATEAAITIVSQEDVRVASFNMSRQDIEAFMVQSWVVSSSDGTNGHPRKFASFPQKYREYVSKRKLMPMHTFVHRSSGKTARIFGLHGRGFIKVGNFADINLIELENYRPVADFSFWNKLSTGISYQVVNGKFTIFDGHHTGALEGVVL